MNTSAVVCGFVQRIIASTDYDELDRNYLTNQVLSLIGQTTFDATVTSSDDDTLDLLDSLLAIGIENGVIADTAAERDVLGAELMDFFAPRPSVVNARFWQLYQENARAALADFYALSQKTNYIKTREIAQNISYTAPTKYGDIDITINLSKPEKTPADIAAARSAPQTTYPACQLCLENEGFHGHANFPGRTNHRIVRVDLNGESWGFQYSPYSYFNEHAIVMAPVHRPMKIDRDNLARLFAFVDLFPDYFIGSNADLPIVGGSILTHDHFQAGRYEMPMARAQIRKKLDLDVAEAGILNWPMSVIRLRDADAQKVLTASVNILEKWRSYSDSARDLVAESTDGTPHHTVTPILRKRDDVYEMDIVLRDNNVSAEFPDGIFHPHPDVQHIKQENIGLIEVMGVAILPPRLKTELAAVADYLVDGQTPVAEKHAQWAQDLRAQHAVTQKTEAQRLVEQSVADIFARVLEDAGVFKNNADGQAGFDQFIQTLHEHV